MHEPRAFDTTFVTTAEIAIAVPVRNEAERLPRLLDALARQIGAPPFTLALLFDNCDDDSHATVQHLAPTLPFPIVTQCETAGGPPNAGLARARAMAMALSIAPDGVLMTTDADSQPAPDWVAANLSALARADVVAGRIVRHPGRAAPLQARLEAYYDRLHALRRRLDPVTWEAADTHHWTSAASLAMTSHVYRTAGGFPPLVHGEDAALADAAARLGLSLRRDARAHVATSARRNGRVSGGFAAQLAAFDRTDHAPAVFHPEDEAWRYTLHAEARHGHGRDGYDRLATSLRLPLAEVSAVAAECANGEAFAARIVGAPPGGMRAVTLSHAERLIAGLEQVRLEGAA